MSSKGVDYKSDEYLKQQLDGSVKLMNKDSVMNERPPLNLTDNVIKDSDGNPRFPDTWELL